jgi:hypothetical protein
VGGTFFCAAGQGAPAAGPGVFAGDSPLLHPIHLLGELPYFSLGAEIEIMLEPVAVF